MVSAKQIDKAMRFLIECQENNPDSGGLPTSVFDSKDKKAIYNALIAEKLVETRLGMRILADGKRESYYCCYLTDKGRLYFIEKQRKQRTSRKQFIQSVVIAVISAVVSTILTLFVSQRSEGSETSSL